MSVDELTSLLGWCSILNIGLLFFATIAMITGGKVMAGIHARLFNMDEKDVTIAYFQYVAQYKIVTIVFNIMPYIALKIMAS